IAFGFMLSAIGEARSNGSASDALRYAGSVASSIRQFQTDTSACETENELEALKVPGGKASKGCRLTTVDTSNGRLLARPTRDLLKVLDGISGYFLVFTKQNQLLYASQPMRDLSLQDQDAVDRVAANLAMRIEDARVRVRQGSLELFVIADSVTT